MTNMKSFVSGVNKMTAEKWDMVAAFTGPEGVGKSTLMQILGAMIDKKFDMEINTSFMPNHREVIEKFNALKPGQVYIIDEAIKVLDKQDWANNLQRSIRQMYATERKQRKVTFLGIPRFTDLAEMFRKHRVRYWFHVPARGYCIAYMRDEDKDVEDPWHIKDNIRMKTLAFGKRSVIDRSIEDILRTERKLPNYWFDFTFDPLPRGQQDKYDALVAKYKAIAGLEENEKEKESRRTKAFKALCLNLFIQGYTTTEISDLTKNMEYDVDGMSHVAIAQYIFDLTKTPIEEFRKRHGLFTDRGRKKVEA